MTLQSRDERPRSTCPTPYDRDSKERQREPIPAALPDVDMLVHDLFYVRNMFYSHTCYVF
jgi:hypothetical protein